jgi:hypothetical protein
MERVAKKHGLDVRRPLPPHPGGLRQEQDALHRQRLRPDGLRLP